MLDSKQEDTKIVSHVKMAEKNVSSVSISPKSDPALSEILH